MMRSSHKNTERHGIFDRGRNIRIDAFFSDNHPKSSACRYLGHHVTGITAEFLFNALQSILLRLTVILNIEIRQIERLYF